MIDVRVYGTKEMAAAARAFGEEGYLLFIERLFEAAEAVKQGVVSRYLTVNKKPDQRGADHIIHRAEAAGAVVIQTLNKSDDPSLRRPNYGPRMMRLAFMPSMEEHAPYVVAQAELALEEARRLFWHGGGSYFRMGVDREGSSPIIGYTPHGQPRLATGRFGQK